MNKCADDPEKQAGRCKKCLDDFAAVADSMKDLVDYFPGFMSLYRLFLSAQPISWEKIRPPLTSMIKRYQDLEDCAEAAISNILKRLVVVKLNGGLGTTMGCSFPKSLITVRNEMTFLDLTVLQLESLNTKYGSSVPLVLMNSFYTDSDTKKVMDKYGNMKTKILTFTQSQYPRISGDSLLPVISANGVESKSSWYPPGHGNFYEAFFKSGLLDQFVEQGRDIAFVANIDNLGATVDLKILNFLATQSDRTPDYIMEVTEKTKADVKGGTLILYEDELRLMEIAQVPNQYIEEFKYANKFKVFNTNNIWMNLRNVKEKLISSSIKLDVITNRKTLDNGSSVIQLETAIGSAIQNFKNSIGINVPRSRFLPVKSNSDLFLVMSNLYVVEEGRMVMNPMRHFQTTPLVQLSGSCFKTVKDFLARFGSIPDILELDHLTVSGDIMFGKDVSLRGTVIILAPHGSHIDIPRGAILENKILSGNLHIVDH